jgi:hypothetical protein
MDVLEPARALITDHPLLWIPTVIATFAVVVWPTAHRWRQRTDHRLRQARLRMAHRRWHRKKGQAW